jgi:hypothetical protein
MNRFTTDHPLVEPPKVHPLLTFFCQTLVVALIILAVTAPVCVLGMLTDNEDVSDTSAWTDYILAPIAFLGVVPAGLLNPDLSRWPPVIASLVGDSLFWGFVFVSIYRISWRYVRNRRLMPPDVYPAPE